MLSMTNFSTKNIMDYINYYYWDKIAKNLLNKADNIWNYFNDNKIAIE